MMESIFHEKQEGYLCAQHCLNALLQGPYFNAVDLANLAHQMDEEERIRMAESGIDSEDYRRFLEQPSGNMDDSGYFSVQVISSALKVWGLELVPYNGTEPLALAAQNDPSYMQAYICNYKGHWFTIRRIGTQWFNLNSMLGGPQLLSDTYLAMYLAQLLQEGYSIFVVMGSLPECVADDVILRNPVSPSASRGGRSVGDAAENSSSGGYRLGTASEENARIIREAARNLEQVRIPIAMSSGGGASARAVAYADSGMGVTRAEKARERIIPIRLEAGPGAEQRAGAGQGAEQGAGQGMWQRAEQRAGRETRPGPEQGARPGAWQEAGQEAGQRAEQSEEADLRRALQLSLREIENSDPSVYPRHRQEHPRVPPPNILDDDDDDEARDVDDDEEMERALRLSLECVTTPATPDPTDDAELRKALQLSLECVTASSTPDPDDLRRRRLAHLGNLARTTANEATSTKLNT